MASESIINVKSGADRVVVSEVNTAGLFEAYKLEKKLQDEAKQINKRKIVIKTDNSQLQQTVETLNKLGRKTPWAISSDFLKEANLSNLDDVRYKVEKFYNEEIPRLKNQLMDMSGNGLIYPEQYEFFTEKLNNIGSTEVRDETFKNLDNFVSMFESELTKAEEIAQNAIQNLFTNIKGGERGSKEIEMQQEDLFNRIIDLSNMGADSSYDYAGRYNQLRDVLNILNQVDSMTTDGVRFFDEEAFDRMGSSLENVGISASDLKTTLNQAFTTEGISNESQAIQALIENLNQLKDTILDIKSILSSISGDGENTSILFDNINNLSQSFGEIEIGEEKFSNPIQAIIQQLANLQSAADNMNFDKIGESVNSLQSVLSGLPQVMQEAFSTMTGIDINITGEKTQAELEATTRTLQAYENIYKSLKSTAETAYTVSMDSTGFNEFDINKFDTNIEKIAAYQGQLNLVDKFLKEQGILDLDTNKMDKSKTWKDFVDKKLVRELSSAKSMATRRSNQVQAERNEIVEKMAAGNLAAADLSAGNISSGDIKGNITGNIEGSINISSIEGLSRLLDNIITKLGEISKSLGSINDKLTDGLKFTESSSQVDELTNKVKELESELLKVKETFATNGAGGQYDSQIQSAKKYVEAEKEVIEAKKEANEAIAESQVDTGAAAAADVIKSEAPAMREVGDAARSAAEWKKEFAQANQQASSTAETTAQAAEAEASAIASAGEASKKANEDALDKRKTVQDQNKRPIFRADTSSKKFDNKYETITKNYEAEYDEDGSYKGLKDKPSSIQIIEDFKKIQNEQASAQRKVELARNKLKSWFQSISNQTFGKSQYISEYTDMEKLYGKDASGIKSVEDIETVLNAMERVQARVKEIQREMTKGNTSSLNPWQNASIAESSLSTSINELERDASRLKDLSPEIVNSINEINESLTRFQGMTLNEGVNGKTTVSIDEYAKTFGDLALKIRETKTAIKDQKIYEATNDVYDPYDELKGQVKRYDTLSKRMTKTELSGKRETDAYKADAQELEKVLTRMVELDSEIRSRPFFDETKLESANQKLINTRKTIDDIKRQAELAGTKTSDMVKMTSDEFNEKAQSYETMARGWLEGKGFTPLDNSVVVNFSNGIAKITAQVKDADNNWKKFSADVDATGKLLNIKTISANAKEQAKYSNAERMSNAQLFDISTFQSKSSEIASIFREKLSEGGYQILGETPSVELLENGLARVSAKIKDVNGNWQQFSTTVDATGATINNATLKPITSNLENLERQLAGGTLASDFTNQATASFEKFFNKVKEGSAGFTEINQHMEEFRTKASQVTDAEGLAAYNKELSGLEESYKRFRTLARAAGKNSQMFLDANGTPAKFGNIEEAVSAAKEYASTIGKIRNITGQIGSKQISEGGIGQFTIQVKTAEGEVRNLKFAYDDFANSMMSNAATKGFERTGLAGYLDRVQAKLQNLTAYWTAMMLNPYMLVGRVKEMVDTIVQLDDALVDLKKTTTMSGADLNQFYFNANESAKELGVTTSEIISQAADWSRLGYSDKESATRMAELSSQFASISPGMGTEEATEGLVSTMKANINAFLYSNMQIECV